MTNPVVLTWDIDAHEHELESAPVAEIARRVSELDGSSRTLVTVYRGNSHAACGGDANSGLVVYATLDNETFHQLVNPDPIAGKSATVVAGGQAGQYDMVYVVGRESAIAALEQFASAGALDPAQIWEDQ